MTETLAGHLTVPTCIGCGARHRDGECPEGCSDVPLDLVDAADIKALMAATEAREIRIAALRELAETVAAGAPVDWAALRDRARAALRLPAPDLPAVPEIEVVQAWGCPRCGRVDAPQPCLGVCIFRPRTVADAREYRQLAPRAEQAATTDRALSGIARLISTVRPRPGQDEATLTAVRARTRHALDQVSVPATGSPTTSGSVPLDS
jgi:hypothetical protein